jgi:hypothetical protein
MGFTYYIPLKGTTGVPGLRLRELDGHSELSAADGTTPEVLEWLDRLVQDATITSGQLAIADRDRVLAAIYRREFGDRIESTIRCGACGEQFEFGFSLEALTEHLGEPAATADGYYRLTDGTRFRPPTGADELAVNGLPAGQGERQLLERCLAAGTAAEGVEAGVNGGQKRSAVDVEDIEAALLAWAPLLSTELAARCPECGREQSLHFDIQQLLFLRLARERREVARQVHLLASTYKWGRQEILSLSREERRAYSSMIDYERNLR